MTKANQVFLMSLSALGFTLMNALAFLAQGTSLHEGGIDAVMAYLSVIFLIVLMPLGIFAYYHRMLCSGKKRIVVNIMFYMQLLIFAMMAATFLFVMQGGAS